MQELRENHAFLSNNVGLLTKGIFSEMFAVEGTKFTESLEFTDSKRFMSNRLYIVKDEQARLVYDYL